jgi:hypothetical protein
MSAALAIPAPGLQPDPDRAGERAFGTGRFVGLLRRVIKCGKDLLIAVRLRAYRPSSSASPLAPRLRRDEIRQAFAGAGFATAVAHQSPLNTFII